MWEPHEASEFLIAGIAFVCRKIRPPSRPTLILVWESQKSYFRVAKILLCELAQALLRELHESCFASGQNLLLRSAKTLLYQRQEPCSIKNTAPSFSLGAVGYIVV